MPEGPSLVILKETLLPFVNHVVQYADGYAELDFHRLAKRKILEIRTHGKQLLILFRDCVVRIHLLMFRSYRIDERKLTKPKLSLHLKNHEINFYACSVRILEPADLAAYDPREDVMSPVWSPGKALRALKKLPDVNVSDALLDQGIFAGVGNIIKNEVLFRIRVHPRSVFASLPPAKKRALAQQAAIYSHDFYSWKKEATLKKHWLIYTKKKCPRCALPVFKEYLGIGKRRTFYCDNCQVRY